MIDLDNKPALIEQAFQNAGIALDEKQLRQFVTYWEELLQWNPRAKLISKGDEGRILERHFLESAVLARFDFFAPDSKIIDLGTGGGFPGLPMKIIKSKLHVTLLDSKRWKILFLRSLLGKLELPDCVPVCGRAEQLSRDESRFEKYDFVVSRAVCELSRLYQLSEGFLKPGGTLLTLKGSTLADEVDSVKHNNQVEVDVLGLPDTGFSASDKLSVVLVRKQ